MPEFREKRFSVQTFSTVGLAATADTILAAQMPISQGKEALIERVWFNWEVANVFPNTPVVRLRRMPDQTAMTQAEGANLTPVALRRTHRQDDQANLRCKGATASDGGAQAAFATVTPGTTRTLAAYFPGRVFTLAGQLAAPLTDLWQVAQEPIVLVPGEGIQIDVNAGNSVSQLWICGMQWVERDWLERSESRQ